MDMTFPKVVEMKVLERGTKEWYEELARLSELLEQWKSTPHDENLNERLIYALRRLALLK